MARPADCLPLPTEFLYGPPLFLVLVAHAPKGLAWRHDRGSSFVPAGGCLARSIPQAGHEATSFTPVCKEDAYGE
ncbi:hypothetical protein CHELA40_13110 [Chelatococcus asaccharovorans]|nr:hypothetical protein CHELA40_13110 [Chelatococcus asaccharovorans]